MNDYTASCISVPIVQWNVDTRDWETRDKDATVKAVMDSVSDGSIILMHDIHESTVDAVEEMIPKLQEKGYRLVTVSELANAKGYSLYPGNVYYSFP